MVEVNKKQIVALAILAGLNILLGNLAVGDGRRLSGEVVEADSPEMRRAVFMTFLVAIQLVSFILGALIAAVPFRQKTYTSKWITFSLWIAIVIQALALAATSIKLVF